MPQPADSPPFFLSFTCRVRSRIGFSRVLSSAGCGRILTSSKRPMLYTASMSRLACCTLYTYTPTSSKSDLPVIISANLVNVVNMFNLFWTPQLYRAGVPRSAYQTQVGLEAHPHRKCLIAIGTATDTVAKHWLLLCSITMYDIITYIVTSVRACWHSESGQDMPSRYLATAGTPVMYYYYIATTYAIF